MSRRASNIIAIVLCAIVTAVITAMWVWALFHGGFNL